MVERGGGRGAGSVVGGRGVAGRTLGPMPSLTLEEFRGVVRGELARSPRGTAGVRVYVPLVESLLSDQLTPVLAYRRLVSADEREAPSFLLESVEGGEREGRYSLLGAQPALEVVAREHEVRVIDRRGGGEVASRRDDPLAVPREMSAGWRVARVAGVPGCFVGGWVGYAGYDTVRYAEPGKMGFACAPRDDRGLADLHLGFYDGVVAFDHVTKVAHVVQLAKVEGGASEAEVEGAYEAAAGALERRCREVQRHSRPLPAGRMPRAAVAGAMASNMTREEHAAMVSRALEYIRAGDIFQVVLGQRFERVGRVDPFDVYRALRVVNPSPYMVYMQAGGCILVASSPEILCRVRREGRGAEGGGRLVVTNRPLAGTRRRGATAEEDAALERELLADAKERAEHVMLVDLGRNDVGRVAEPGTIALPAVMEVERYSHVMHISSTVTGVLRAGLDCWDALRAALPVGTVSGAPKVRAMQVIDELEPVRRGPYGGGMGYATLDGEMDMALTLRTIVATRTAGARAAEGEWTYHVQASGGIVADSRAEAEYEETVNKAAALARAIDVAERAFGAGA